jgi:rod shape-determining protein MreC
MAQRSANLAALLDLRTRVNLPTVAAEVIGGDAIPGLHTVTINRGAADGVHTDAAVISPAGVVGRVVGAVAPHAARVQLLISPNAGAGVMIERTRAGGVVVSGGEGQPLALDYVSNLSDVKPGDLVVTAGTDGIYPKGFPVGRVETVKDGAGLYKDIRVRPVVDFSNVEEVLVILGPPPPAEEQQAAEGRP